MQCKRNIRVGTVLKQEGPNYKWKKTKTPQSFVFMKYGTVVRPTKSINQSHPMNVLSTDGSSSVRGCSCKFDNFTSNSEFIFLRL